MATVTTIAAVILAGGKAERLGGINKALLEIKGRSLIHRVSGALAGCSPMLLAVGQQDFAVPGLLPVFDLDADYAGPLAGFAAAVQALRDSEAELLLSVAVDTPFFPTDLIERALPLMGKAVVASYGAQDYPTNALWRLDAVRDLPAAVLAGTAPHSLKRLLAGLGAVRLDYSVIASEDPFANVNTPADLALLTARASM